MATPERSIITTNEPFDNLTPLTDYLVSLDAVTTGPSPETIAELEFTDRTLTDRAVLFPEKAFVFDEGWRVIGYRPCGISSVVANCARIALLEPGSSEYDETYNRLFRDPRVDATSEEEDNDISVTTTPEPLPDNEVRFDPGTLKNRQNNARGALMALGGHIAVSGAFWPNDIEPAYEAIRASLELLGERSEEEDFVQFGLRRIGLDLLNQYWYVQHRGARQNPISKPAAVRNIHTAWGVVGRPYGRLSWLVSTFAKRPTL